MDDPAIGAAILEMDEPGFPGRRIDPRSLMRPVYIGFPLIQHDLDS